MKKLSKYDTFDLDVKEILVDPDFNCRGSFTLQSVSDLADSIRETGLDEPVIVQPIADTGLKLPYKWRLLTGFRRFTAVVDLLKWKTIPARIRKGLSDADAAHLNFRENVERKNLNAVEEALWIDKHFEGQSLRAISKVVGRDTRWVHQRQRLARLPSECHAKFAAGMLTFLDVDSLAQLATPAEQNKAAEMIIEAKRLKDRSTVTKLRKARTFQPRKSKAEIGRMLGRLMDNGNKGLILRFGAWCAGWVTDEEFEKDFQKAGRKRRRSHNIRVK